MEKAKTFTYMGGFGTYVIPIEGRYLRMAKVGRKAKELLGACSSMSHGESYS